jgi:hypothetical protein
MTTETKVLIELADITGLAITCPKCGFVGVLPFDKPFKLGPQCMNCAHHWFDEKSASYPSGEGRYPAIDSLQAIASELRKITKPDRTDIHAEIRLNLKPSPAA